jgi:hypothetical protein
VMLWEAGSYYPRHEQERKFNAELSEANSPPNIGNWRGVIQDNE